jgi:uncharacterized protein
MHPNQGAFNGEIAGLARQRIAIIGSGIAGLACAHQLHPHHDITVFEQDRHIGGHANTITVLERANTPDERPVPIDTGFMVFNHQTYPNLCKLFDHLEVPTQPTDMSFSLSHQAHNLEWRGADVAGMFGQKRNWFRPAYWGFVKEILRFNRQTTQAMAHGRDADFAMPLSVYIKSQGYSAAFLNHFIVPLSSAIWSTSADNLLEFPAHTLLRFFYNHGFLGHFHQWYTVTGGSQVYVDKLVAPFRDRIQLDHAVQALTPAQQRSNQGVTLRFEDGHEQGFDAVILACHADQALTLLDSTATPLERQLLGAFGYERNLAVLHGDTRLMPQRKACWAAWNYRVEADNQTTSTHYWMNRLQQVSDREPYLVSINPPFSPQQEYLRIPYTHPRFNMAAMQAQPELSQLNQQPGRPIYFCGSYFRYGFHEDALTSGLDLCQQVFGLTF